MLQPRSLLGRDKFVALHDRWRTHMPCRGPAGRTVVPDLDTAVLTVYGRQQRAAVGFNPKKRGRPSYVPLLCFDRSRQKLFQDLVGQSPDDFVCHDISREFPETKLCRSFTYE